MSHTVVRAAAMTLILIGAALAGRLLGPEQELEGQLGGISIASWIVAVAASMFFVSARMSGLNGALLGVVAAGALGWSILPVAIPVWIFIMGFFFLIAGTAFRIFNPD